MLVRFTVENYLSFDKKTEFNMLTGNPRRLPHHVYQCGEVELLKMAAVYGANGAGKSNFVRAIVNLRNLVYDSNIGIVQSNAQFKLEIENKTAPTKFEIEFIKNNLVFFYVVSYYNAVIKHEELSIINKDGIEDKIFKRFIDENGKIKIDFNEKYTKTQEDKFRIKIYEQEILKNQETLLFKLNEAREGFKEVKIAFSWFSSIQALKPNLSVSNVILANPAICKFVRLNIKDFNTGVDDFVVTSSTLDEYLGKNNSKLKEEIKRKLQYEYIVDVGKIDASHNPVIAYKDDDIYMIMRIVTCHLNKKGEKIVFYPSEESDGTLRLWDLLALIYFAIEEPFIVIIDEIEHSIHPNLLKQLITKFSENKETKGQLIFTTHETHLLDQEIFRQDEIWMAEKNSNGATELYPMSDFNVRYDLDIRKGYLNGRFGGIPFLHHFKDLTVKPHATNQ
jgi:uncharacterized protein